MARFGHGGHGGGHGGGHHGGGGPIIVDGGGWGWPYYYDVPITISDPDPTQKILTAIKNDPKLSAQEKALIIAQILKTLGR